MMFVILVAAIGLALSGLLVIAYGFAVQLSTGNTMIMAGVVSLCTGAIMLGFWTTIRELRAIARKLGSGVPAAQADVAVPMDEAELKPVTGFPAAEPRDAPGFESASPPPWQNDSVLRDHPIPEPLHPESPQHPEPPPAPKAKRNLLFSSTRRERARSGEPFSPELLSSELRSRPSAEASEPSPGSFQEGWSRSERVKPTEAPLPRRGGRAPPPLTANDDPASAGATVLKSGIVDGMAYSLFSDGSIEAQMPEGMMRFSSIDELRAHLDQRS